MSLGSSPATPTRTAHNHTCDHSRDPNGTAQNPTCEPKIADVDKSGDESVIFRGLAVEEIVDSI